MGAPLARAFLLLGLIGGAIAVLSRRRGRSGSRNRPASAPARVVLRGGPLRCGTLDEISICSYNILGDSLAGNLRHVHPDFLAWEHRRPILMRELGELDADLVCLQEVDTDRQAVQRWIPACSLLLACSRL
jgi:hypothetical protein